MRGTVAKRIRHEVYGDQSLKQERTYTLYEFFKTMKRFVGKGAEGADEKGIKLVELKTTTIKNVGFRRVYQQAKRRYYE
jgi:hypothetical protein